MTSNSTLTYRDDRVWIGMFCSIVGAILGGLAALRVGSPASPFDMATALAFALFGGVALVSAGSAWLIWQLTRPLRALDAYLAVLAGLCLVCGAILSAAMALAFL